MIADRLNVGRRCRLVGPSTFVRSGLRYRCCVFALFIEPSFCEHPHRSADGLPDAE